jgi:hypothetical protein
VVVRSLQEEGLAAREDVLTDVFRNVEKAWALGKTVQTHTAREATVQGRRSY